MLPKGCKEQIRKHAESKNMSMNEYIWSAILKDMHTSDSLQTTDISNRRYVGSKQSLLPFIKNALQNIHFNSFADLFAGTGIVANAFNNNKRNIITNDILYSNYLCHYAWFSNYNYDESKIRNILIQYNSIVPDMKNYVTEIYGDKYFSQENASKIGCIRDNIETLKNNGAVNKREYALLIMSLLYAAQRADISRTVGHYMSFLKKPKPDGKLELQLPLAPYPDTNKGNQCYNIDAMNLIQTMPSVDLIYIDPPYQRQYGEYYHVLENIALWKKEPTFGTTKRIHTPKSQFSIKRTATKAFAELIQQCCNKTKYILISDNNDNMNHIRNIDIMEILSEYSKVRVFTIDYPVFHGSKKNYDNKERLFLCKIK